MPIANSLRNFMLAEGVKYDVLSHTHSSTSSEAAQAAHVPGDRLAKAVLLEDDSGYVLAVLPASCRLELGALHHALHRRLGLATESEVGELFRDCELGAIPPFGEAYGIDTVLDDSLMGQPEVYFEAGDHEELIRVSGDQFRELFAGALHGHFSRHG